MSTSPGSPQIHLLTSCSAKFAPTTNQPDTYTSPRVRPVDAKRTPPQRTPSVSERIAKRLKEIQKKSVEALAAAAHDSDEETSAPVTPKVDKGKGRAVEEPLPESVSPVALTPAVEQPPAASSPVSNEAPLPAPPILLAGIAFPPPELSKLLTKAAAELPLRSVRFPLLGEYHECFTGEELVAWLLKNVPAFGEDFDVAEQAAKDLVEGENLLRRIGEFGNSFEDSDDAWYQIRPKVREEASIQRSH